MYLFRHGESERNTQTHIVGGRSNESELTQLGIVQQQRLGAVLLESNLFPDKVFSSPAVRARHSAEITLQAMGLNLEIIEDDRLQEQDTGSWTGRLATEIYTPETLAQIGILGKDFKSPGGESMNEVGQRMVEWINSLEEGRVLFAFTHGGAIRSLPSTMHNWSHEKTYTTRPDNASISLFTKQRGLWQVSYLNRQPEDQPLKPEITPLHSEICSRITDNEIIREHVESIIWFGSTSNEQDVHLKSDCDLQIVLDKPDYNAVLELGTILEDYRDVDLSIMYLKDMYDDAGNVIFQDGTKGLFFVHVLAAGQVLHGRNVYAEIAQGLTTEDLKPSILFTIREYLSRLRIMATHSPNDTLRFKKYSLKLFKDILIYDETVPPKDVVNVTYREASQEIALLHEFSEESKEILSRICDFETNYTKEEMARLLCEYENIVDKVCNG